MKKVITLLFSIFVLFSCNRTDDTESIDIIGQNITTLVEPIQTNTNYSSTDKEHYIVRNNQVHLNKLLLFIGGSFSTPQSYSLVCDHAASLGLDVMFIIP